MSQVPGSAISLNMKQGAFSPLTFTVGGIQLNTWEVPESFEHGHEVATAIMKFIDENGNPIKHVHAMGAFPIKTQWTGEMYGVDALDRDYQLDSLCAQQQEIQWLFGPLSYNVLITSYKGRVRYDKLVEYTIELEIIDDLNGSGPTSDQTAQFDTLTQQTWDTAQTHMLNAATAQTNALALGVPIVQIPSGVTSAQSDLQTAVNGAVPLSSATPSQLQTIVSKVSSFANQTQPYLQSLQNQQLGGPMSQIFTELTNALNAYQLFSGNVTALQGNGPSTTQVSEMFAAGTSLFRIAARYYPNSNIAQTAQIIAAANNIQGLVLANRQVVNIPAIFNQSAPSSATVFQTAS